MAEYIEREALRKILANWRDAHADVDDEQGCGLLEDVICEVDAQPAAAVAPVSWISVNDRLPDVNRTKSGYESMYVIATNGKRVWPMIYERACIKTKMKFRWKYAWDRIYDRNDIIAWMPLPKPPKMDGEE